MKNYIMAFGPLFVLCATLVLSCVGGAEAAEGETTTFGSVALSGGTSASGQASSGGEVKTLNDVEGKEWSLLELRSAGTTVRINRSKIDAANISDSFTISFQDNRVSGMGWPNRYFGPYTAGSGDALSIGNVASTMMAAFAELDELKEHEYFAYLSNVTRWAVRDGRLELYSSSGGRETTLVFTLK